ncbi:MAG TPA: TolC family protein [Pseudobdellovibrionaceae bacterium]|nr:TolC family protein [Pseudobdellovibrionaceae bacterium]
MVNKRIFFVSCFCVFATVVSAQTADMKSHNIQLSQKKVAEIVLKQSPSADEINQKYLSYRLGLFSALGTYDWKLSAESGYEYDKSQSISFVNSSKYDRYRTTLNVGKSIASTGSNIGLEFSRLSQVAEIPTSLTSTIPTRGTLDIAGLTFEQNLLANSFGYADRASLAYSELLFNSQMLGRADELQDLVLKALRQFWNTYVAQENFHESLATRDRYKKLVDNVRRKASFGYSSPAELPQILAEFENREQLVKTASLDYLKQLDDLLVLLNLPAGSEIQFEVPKDLPQVPQLKEASLAELRSLKSQKMRVSAFEEQLKASKSKSYPTVNFVGKIYSTGEDQDSEGSQSALFSGTHPKYYVGVKFQYNFGSDLQTEDIINKRVNLQIEKIKMDRLQRDRENALGDSQRKVDAQYEVVKSLERQLQYRSQAVADLNRTYNQGRTDLSLLIDAMNRHATTEIQLSRAVGDYQIALNELAAKRDELVKEEGGNL